MLGEYTFYVSRNPPTESVTLCNTAVIGTSYICYVALPENVEVQPGCSITLSVTHVHAADIIGNVLAIDLRLALDSELTTQVKFSNGSTTT